MGSKSDESSIAMEGTPFLLAWQSLSHVPHEGSLGATWQQDAGLMDAAV